MATLFDWKRKIHNFCGVSKINVYMNIRESIMQIQSYEEFTKFIKTNIPEIKQITKNSSKEFWIRELENRKFEDYYITNTPSKLKEFGIVNEVICISLNNMAYILSRHSKEYPLESYLKMKETIEDYDVLLKGNHQNDLDFRFYKLCTLDNIPQRYGIEVVIDKKSDFEYEYIVHFNLIGRKRNAHLRNILS